MGKECVFPLRKGSMKNIKKEIWKDETKKSDERRMKEQMEEYKEWKTQKGVFEKKNQVIKMEDSQKKDTKKRAWKEEEEEKKKKTTKKQKKVKIHRKNGQKRYSFKRRGSKKMGDTIIEYKRDRCETQFNFQKTFSKINSFFFKNRKNDGMFQKRRFFFVVQEAEKTQIGDAKSDQKSSKKEKKSKTLYPEGRKNGTRRDMCFFFSKKKTNWKREKKKGDEKPKFNKKIKGEDKPEERNEKRKRGRKKRGL